jgi:predicted Mrr-cat superfamily restriction endonuclease
MKIVKIVTHHEKPDRAAELFAEEGVVAVGWADVGDISGKSREEIKAFLIEEWGQSEQEAAIGAASLLRFRDEIEVGDLVFAYKGRNAVALVGEVTGGYEFNVQNRVGDPNGEIGYPNQRKVNWWTHPRNFDRSFLPEDLSVRVALPGTIHIFDVDEYYIEKLEESLRQIPPEETRRIILEVEDEDEIKRFMRNKLSDLDEGLTLVQPEYSTSVGNMDFLARDRAGFDVVIEVKVKADDSAVGQVLGYMQAYKEESGAKDVKGVIVAQEFTDRCKKAAKASNLDLYICEKKFAFSKIK